MVGAWAVTGPPFTRDPTVTPGEAGPDAPS